MNIEIKRSIKPVNYNTAIQYLEKRVEEIIIKNKKKELIWFLEHPSVYTGGSSFKKEEILDNSINIIKTSRGGKITWHGPGQLICYFVIDLNKRKKDVRKFVSIIEQTIIDTLKEYKIYTETDKKNIGIWHRKGNQLNKIAAIGIRVRRWIAYHGFSINIKNNLNYYDKIIPCGIKDRGVTNLNNVKKLNYIEISKKIERNLIKYLKS